jgi:hypothetical protein
MPPAVGQFSQDSGGRSLFESAFGLVHNGGGGSSDACDVLQSEDPRTASVGGIEDVEEEPGAAAVEPCARAGNGEVLAREACNDCVHHATKSPVGHGSQIAEP